MRHIPVFMYHQVCEKGEVQPSPFVVDVDVFERQLQFFSKLNYYTPSIDDVLSKRVFENNSNKKPVLLTFDDGYVDTLKNAVPLLQKYGFTANVFVVADFSRRSNFWDAAKNISEAPLMEKSQVVELRQKGIEVGSHSWSHPSLPLLDDTILADEFVQSKRSMEEVLQEPVRYFAYPYGEVDERVKEVARKAGYLCAFATNSGPMRLHDDLFRIRREIVCNNANPVYLYIKLSGIEKALRVVWSFTKKVIGKKPRYQKP